jgi:hypothetical protein
MAQLLPFELNRRQENQAASDREKLQTLIADLQFLLIACPFYFDVVAQVARELAERA